MTTHNTILCETISTTSNYLIGIIELNNMKSFNALSLEMIQAIKHQLQVWIKCDEIACIVLKGKEQKVFSVGGDIKRLYDSMCVKDTTMNQYAEDFFSQEYQLDYFIHRYPKPVICLAQGLVIGGGVGLMLGASHRIVTDSTRISMPEITIGLFPDVGVSRLLSRLPDGLGTFIALTAARLNAGDAMYTGFATHYLPEDEFIPILKKLAAFDWNEDSEKHHEQLDHFFYNLSKHYLLPDSYLQRFSYEIQNIMRDQATPDLVLSRLKATQDDELEHFSNPLETGSPCSAWIIHEQMKQAANMTLEDIFCMDMTLAIQCVQQGDLREGIRARLITRDNQPQWIDSSLTQVSSQRIQAFFQSPWELEKHPLHGLQTMKMHSMPMEAVLS
ncbi:MAG: enoyl-CoA hydratase/isomerase family protein [Endozoicomonadaceae bacterium]|nr:enoyl-CoA hydratase/isomerase family protein [Endozoicomonadaceae bacterium]